MPSSELHPEGLKAAESLIQRLADLITEIEATDARAFDDAIAELFMEQVPEVLQTMPPDEKESAAQAFGIAIFGREAFDTAKLDNSVLYYGAPCEWGLKVSRVYLTADDAGMNLLQLAALAVWRNRKP